MKTTMIFAGNGDTFLYVACKPGEITHRNIRLQSTLDFAEIIPDGEGAYAVRFRIPYFARYNKSGFISKQSALNYEQDMLDAHFDEYVENDASELCADDIA